MKINPFRDRLLVFNNTIWLEKCRKNGKTALIKTVHKKNNKQKSKIYREFSLHGAYYKISSKGLNENLKVQAEHFLLESHSGFKRTHLASIHYLM